MHACSYTANFGDESCRKVGHYDLGVDFHWQLKPKLQKVVESVEVTASNISSGAGLSLMSYIT